MAKHSARVDRPVLKLGAVASAAAAVVPAILALLVAFGVDLTDSQTAAILGLIAAIGAAAPVTAAKQAEKVVSPVYDKFEPGSSEFDEG